MNTNTETETTSTVEPAAYNLLDNIIAYEQGDLDDEQALELFQHIYDEGHYTWLQGSYGRTLQVLLDRGLIRR